MQSGSSDASGPYLNKKSSSAVKLGESAGATLLNIEMEDNPLAMKPSLSVMDRPNDK